MSIQFQKAEITPGLFDKSDFIAQRKYYNLKAFDAFFESGLEQVLKNHAIKNLFICGFATGQCPARTLRTALRKGFNAYLVSDCTATFNGSFQRMAEHKHSDRVVTSHMKVESGTVNKINPYGKKVYAIKHRRSSNIYRTFYLLDAQQFNLAILSCTSKRIVGD